MSRKTNVSLHNIEGVRSIEDLAPHYDLIKSHLYVLTNKRGADMDDLMQDFYIKMYNYFNKYPNKVINGGFVSNTLRNMLRNYYNSVSKNKTEYEHNLVDREDSDLEIADKLKDEELYQEMYEKIEELDWVERTILEYSLIMSIAELSRLSEIPYQNIIYTLNKAKSKLGIK